MRVYPNNLPLYEEPSENFMVFIREFERHKSYTVQSDRQFSRLKFIPTDLSENSVEGLIPLSALKHPNLKVLSKEEIMLFATKFNLMSSLYNMYSGKRKCEFNLSLIEDKKTFPASKRVIAVTFAIDDMDLSMTIDNLLKTIK